MPTNWSPRHPDRQQLQDEWLDVFADEERIDDEAEFDRLDWYPEEESE